jgi:hypothetical protein
MSTVKRFSAIKVDKGELDENGFLRARATATRVGVFRYVRPDGSLFRELRLPDEVFHPDSLKTLKMVPVTLEHPDAGLVTPENAKQLQVGFTGDVSASGVYVETEVVVTDKKAIESVNKGKRETSCGYTCNLDETPGEWEGQSYDAIQRNIRYNHLAIVTRGRAGSSVRLHLDSLDAVETEEKQREDKNMAKIKLGDKSYEVSDEVKEAFDNFMEKSKAKEDKIEEEKKDLEAKKKEADKKADALQAKVDHFEAESTKEKTKMDADKQKETFDAAVKARVELVKLAEKAKLEKHDSMTERELKVALIKTKRADFSDEGRSDEYVEAAFDMAKAELEKTEPASKKIGAEFTKGDGEGETKETPEQVRARRMREDSELWKKPGGVSKTV